MGALQVSLGDSLNNWNDTLTDTPNGKRALTDSMLMRDDIKVLMPLQLTIGDRMEMSDSFAPTYNQSATAADTLSMSDAVAVQNNTNLSVSVADTLSMSDAVSKTGSDDNLEYLRRYLNDK